MRIGTDRRSVSGKAVKEAMSRTVKQKNVGSPAFDVNDPVQRLLFTIGSGFFGEHKFYDSLQPKDAQGHRTSKAKVTAYQGKAITRPTNKTDELGMNETAQDLLSTMRQIAEDPEKFEDLLVAARWAREDLNLRQTPLMALVIAARVESELSRGTGLVRKYAPAILKRADEPKRAFAAYRHLFMEGKDGMRQGTLPRGLARGLIESLQKFNEYQILKYDNPREKPTFRELALLLSKYEGRGKGRGKRKNMRAFTRPMAQYLITGEVDEKALPKAAARQKLFKLKTWGPRAQGYAKKGDVTWENLISQFGSSKDVWEWLIENKQIPYMATLRNLRNFQQVDISEDHWEMVYNLLASDANHRQLPFRFLAARKAVTDQTAISAIDIALDKSVDNVPDMPGKTFIMVDVSGSMTTALSGKSKMTAMEAGLAMAAILAKKLGRRAIIGVFGTRFKRVTFSEADSVMTIVDKMVVAAQEVDWATHAHLALKWLLGEPDSDLMTAPKRTKVDRIVVVSDMNCYSRGGWGGENLVPLLTRYRAEVNKDAFYYSVNLMGGSQAQMDPQNKKTLLLSGFSEKIFSLFAQFEQSTTDTPDAVVPTIEELRRKFSLTRANGNSPS